MDPGLSQENVKVRPKAPGMRYKHYAPKGDLCIVEGDTEKVIAKINALAKEAVEAGETVGIIATEETKDRYQYGRVLTIGSREDEDSIAHNLYGVLREFDTLGDTKMFTEGFKTPRIGQAIMNRLLKAAGHKVINV